MHESEKWKWSCSVASDSLQSRGLQPTRLLCPWDFPGKSTGMGCHCLLRKSLPVYNYGHAFFFNFKDKLKSSFWNDNYEPVLEMSYIWRSIKDVFYNHFSINNNTFLRNLKIRLLSIENWCFSPIVSTSESIWKVGQRQQPCACVWFWFHLHSCPDSCGLDPFQILCLTVACMKYTFLIHGTPLIDKQI